MKNPILFFILLIFTIVNFIDLITAQFILPGESNPLFLLFGNFYIVGALKIGINVMLWIWYKRNIYTSQFMYYNIIVIGVLGTFALSVGVYSNIMGMLNPSIVIESAQIATSEKLVYYGYFISIIYFIPYLLNIFLFKLWEWSVKKIIINPKIKW